MYDYRLLSKLEALIKKMAGFQREVGLLFDEHFCNKSTNKQSKNMLEMNNFMDRMQK